MTEISSPVENNTINKLQVHAYFRISAYLYNFFVSHHSVDINEVMI